jgi:transposase-like protein
VVRPLERGEKSLGELCRELGFSQQFVCQRKREFSKKGDGVFPGMSKNGKKPTESIELKKEIERLKEENEILKSRRVFCQGHEVKAHKYTTDTQREGRMRNLYGKTFALSPRTSRQTDQC